MNFLTKSLAFVGIASFAATANADCTTDFDSDAFQGFLTTMGVYYDDDATVEIPALCLAAGGDIFAFSGTTTCGDQVDDHYNGFMCLPTSCTSNESDIALKIPMLLNEGESCTGSYTYDGLGDGTPDSLSCQFDLMENDDTLEEFSGLFRKTMFSDDCIQYSFSNAEPPEECQPDYTVLQTLCQDNGMDYFTVSFTRTCGDADGTGGELIIEMTKDFPYCFPSSCTSDEAALKATFGISFDGSEDTDYGLVCTISDLIFSGLDEEDTTSGGSFRGSIAGSVLMLAVASAALL